MIYVCIKCIYYYKYYYTIMCGAIPILVGRRRRRRRLRLVEVKQWLATDVGDAGADDDDDTCWS